MTLKVHLWSGLRALTGGAQVVEVEASTIDGMLRELVRLYPALQEPIEAGVSVSVDGRIMASDLTAPLRAENEIYLMQRLRGG
ncbi:MAG: MoaD/ThiS family protein [Paracoccaceae bacterium]